MKLIKAGIQHPGCRYQPFFNNGIQSYFDRWHGGPGDPPSSLNTRNVFRSFTLEEAEAVMPVVFIATDLSTHTLVTTVLVF